MRPSVGEVIARLRAEHGELASVEIEGPARAALADAAAAGDDMPWYVRAAVGIGAWAATGFLLAFLVTVAGLKDDAARLLVGAVLVAAGIWIRRTQQSEFLRQAAVAGSLAGQGLFIVAVHDLVDATGATSADALRAAAVSAALLSAAVLWAMPDRVHRFISAIVFGVALYVALVDGKSLRGFEVVTLLLVGITALVWRLRPAERGESVAAMLEPAGYGLLVVVFGALLMAMAARFVGVSPALDDLALGAATTVGIALAHLVLVWLVFDGQGAERGRLAAMAAVVALALGSLSTPGISAGAAVLTLAFDRRNRVLLGMGIVFLLVFASVYYYSLHITLLAKSAVLAGSGAVLLAFRHLLARP